MPNTGNFYIATLKKTHLGWGTHRKTTSRQRLKAKDTFLFHLNGTLFFDIEQIIVKHRPKVVFLANVKNYSKLVD